MLGQLWTDRELPQGSNDPQTSPYGPLGIIFVCLWIAKIDQESIA